MQLLGDTTPAAVGLSSIPIHRAIAIELPVSAIRLTHDTVDGRAIFRHDEDTQEKLVGERPSAGKQT